MNIKEGDNSAFFRKLNAMPQRIKQAEKIALTRAGTEMQGKAVPWAPVKTGNLRRSITMKQGKDYVVVGTNLQYARVHDSPSVYIKPHTRTSAFGKKTRPFQVKGRWAKPYRGRGYLLPAFLLAKRNLPRIMKEEITAAFRK